MLDTAYLLKHSSKVMEKDVSMTMAIKLAPDAMQSTEQKLLRCIKAWDSHFAGHFCVMFDVSYLQKYTW